MKKQAWRKEVPQVSQKHEQKENPNLWLTVQNFSNHKKMVNIYWVLSMCQGFPGSSDSKASAYNAGDQGSIPGLERSPGEGNSNPIQN